MGVPNKKGGKRKSGGKKGGRRAKRAKGDASGEERGDSSGDDDSEEEEEAAVQPAARAPRAKRSKPAAAAAAPKEWAKKAKNFLEEIAFGNDWVELIGQWWTREENKGFLSPVRGLSAKKRPGQIASWVQRARTGEPEINDVSVFAKETVSFWQDINPAWRKKNVPMLKQNGDWTPLEIPGPNGILNVLVCLKWWRERLEDESPEWKEVVEDVTWVLKRMNG
ncbi:hypothetical protein DFH06DRAFT_994257 [Mycena polygramma]|nr:hypothetical protein DFH06DRAFT_994257 [Mycena polygramma]